VKVKGMLTKEELDKLLSFMSDVISGSVILLPELPEYVCMCRVCAWTVCMCECVRVCV